MSLLNFATDAHRRLAARLDVQSIQLVHHLANHIVARKPACAYSNDDDASGGFKGGGAVGRLRFG